MSSINLELAAWVLDRAKREGATAAEVLMRERRVDRRGRAAG